MVPGPGLNQTAQENLLSLKRSRRFNNVRSFHTHRAFGFAMAIAVVLAGGISSRAQAAKGRVIDREIRSQNIVHNKIGTDPVRKMMVYLPAGYDASTKHYPVIYFLPTPFES